MAEPTSLVPLGREGTGAATVLQSTPFLQERAKMQMLERQNIAKQEAAMADAIAKKAEADAQKQKEISTMLKIESNPAGAFEPGFAKVRDKIDNELFNFSKIASVDQSQLPAFAFAVQKGNDLKKTTGQFLAKEGEAIVNALPKLEQDGWIANMEDVASFINKTLESDTFKNAQETGNINSLLKPYTQEFVESITSNPKRFNYAKRGSEIAKITAGKKEIEIETPSGVTTTINTDNFIKYDPKTNTSTIDAEIAERIIRSNNRDSDILDGLITDIVSTDKISPDAAKPVALGRYFNELGNVKFSIKRQQGSGSAKEKEIYVGGSTAQNIQSRYGDQWTANALPLNDVKGTAFKNITLPANTKFTVLTKNEGDDAEEQKRYLTQGAEIGNVALSAHITAAKDIQAADGKLYQKGDVVPPNVAKTLPKVNFNVEVGYDMVLKSPADKVTLTERINMVNQKVNLKTVSAGGGKAVDQIGRVFISMKDAPPAITGMFEKSLNSKRKGLFNASVEELKNQYKFREGNRIGSYMQTQNQPTQGGKPRTDEKTPAGNAIIGKK